MKNLDQPRILVEAVINSNRGMEDFADIRPLGNGDTHAREVLYSSTWLRQGYAKSFGRGGVVGADVVEDDLQVD